jgi:iron-sulfur cluster assembly protein
METTQQSAINLTGKAASELKNLMESEGKAEASLRVWVAGGGCSGLQYGMALDDGSPEPDDLTFESEGVKLLVDSLSIQYMNGAVVDYIDDEMGGGFKIENPNAVRSCGCGSSFQTEEGPGSEGGCGSCGMGPG